MTQIRSLRELLASADRALGLGSADMDKQASGSGSDEVSSFAAALLSADDVETKGESSGSAGLTDFEKTAMALNRVHADAYLDSLLRGAAFENEAGRQGYQKQQIEEALDKTAAAAVLRSLPALAAAEALTMKGPMRGPQDKKKKISAGIGQTAGVVDATETVGR